MSAAKKYKHYKVDSEESNDVAKDKVMIKALQEKIADKLAKDPELQKKAALILEKLINK